MRSTLRSGVSCYPISDYSYEYKSDLKCTLNKSWTYKHRIGKPSSYGEVWQACCEKDCRYVAKYQSFEKPSTISDVYYSSITPEDIKKEVKLQNSIAEIGLSIPVLDAWVCKHGGVMIMKILKQTVSDLLYEYRTITVRTVIISEVLSLLKTLHSEGFYHGDSHLNNIMVDYNSDNYKKSIGEYPNNELKRYKRVGYKYYFIDMGRSGILNKDNQQEIKQDFIKVYTDLKHLVEDDMKLGKLSQWKKIFNNIEKEINDSP